MSGLLKNGTKIPQQIGEVTIQELLGSGGQGEVYKVSYQNKNYALKWYFPDSATVEQKKIINDLIAKKSPNETFLWPLYLIESSDYSSFGYIMDLRAKNYKEIVDLMKKKCSPSFYTLCTVGFQTSNSFLQLHTSGLCYKDISFGNLFFDPSIGNVQICDNDNVTSDVSNFTGVLGTPKFMAPEIVRGDKKPSAQSDLYSLAALLFYVFFVHHPLDGKLEHAIKCLDAPAMKKLYGDDPIFIFDPNNDTNRPVKGYHDNASIYWDIFPSFFKDLFIQAFTDGIHDPLNGRVRESEWRNKFVQLRDSIFYCECGSENFYDIDFLAANQGKSKSCWSCGKTPVLPFRIKIGKSIIMLNHDSKLYPHHIDDKKTYDFSKLIAEVTKRPNDPSIWGLKNVSDEKWVMVDRNGNLKDILPQQSFRLENGLKIQFGNLSGEVRY